MKPEPLTEAERLYAESYKYGGEVFMLIPLPSGRFAVMGAGRRIEGGYPSDTLLSAVEYTRPQVRYVLQETIPTSDPELNLEITL